LNTHKKQKKGETPDSPFVEPRAKQFAKKTSLSNMKKAQRG